MDNAEFLEFAQRALQKIKLAAPFKTGNLRYNAIKLESRGPGVVAILVDMDIAPYMPYTTEPWISDKWKGKNNPNEKWWDNVCEEVIQGFASELGAEVRRL